MIRLMPSAFHRPETRLALADFIATTDQLSLGPQVAAFEHAFATHQGRQHAIAVNSGSSANLVLIQALLNLGHLSPNDKVGFSALGWITTVSPLLQLGLHPVPIDISSSTLNVSVDTIFDVLSKHDLKAIFLTHLLGLCDDIVAIKHLCQRRGILLIEDACEALGSEAGGFKLGNVGIASTFSTYVGHHLSTIEGGLVATDDATLANELLMVRSHGWARQLGKDCQTSLAQKHNVSAFHERFTFYTLGYNVRPTEITGFLGLEALKDAPAIYAKRAENFAAFQRAAWNNHMVQHWDVGAMSLVSNFAYPVVYPSSDARDRAVIRAQEQGIEVRPIVGGCLPDQPVYRRYDRAKYHLPNARHAHQCGLYLPNNPSMTEDEVDQLCAFIAS